MEFENTEFAGLKIVHSFRAPDSRGIFVKPWLAAELAQPFGPVAEAYFSFSQKGVFRGLHYQRGGKAQKKYVVCLSGAIEDVALDMRPDSPTFGKVFRVRLEAMDGRGVIVPEGFAHGIFAHESAAIVNFCDKPYAPGDEGGIHWQSLPSLADLAVTQVSEKDAALPAWTETES